MNKKINQKKYLEALSFAFKLHSKQFRKGTKTERDLSQSEVEEIRSLLFSTLDQTEADYNARVFKNYKIS